MRRATTTFMMRIALAASVPVAAVPASTGPAAAADPGPTAAADAASLAALEYAFRFASAIKTDAKDRAKAQELALDEYVAAGAWEEAARRATEIEGWRRGVVYAGVASSLARAGREDEARSFVAKAEAVRQGVTGWENPRLSAHVAEVLALLGDTEQANAITANLASADPVQYAGRATATEAVGQAASGNFGAAMDRLRGLESDDNLDVAWSRTMGYLALARESDLPKSSRLEAIDAARASAARLPLERRLDALLLIAPEHLALGRKRDARETVAAAAKALDEHGPRSAEAIAGLIAIGQGWGRVGEPQRARKSLEEAEALVPQALSIDQPGLLARIASGYRAIPDATRARRLDLKAVDNAAAMRLSRPRALALAAICRQMGRDGVAPDTSMSARLESLLGGLGEPW